MRTIALALLISLVPAVTFAGETPPPPRAPSAPAPFEFRGSMFSGPAWAPQPRERDSLKEGAIIGAVVGGLIMGTFVGVLCNAMREPGNPSCLPATLLWSGVAAGAGAAAGAGIDALFTRRTAVAFSVKF